MNITVTNGNIDSAIINYCKAIVDADYEHYLCGTNNREWYFVQAAHVSGNHYSGCTVYRFWYDTYIPNSPATTLYLSMSSEQDVYIDNPHGYAVYSSSPGFPHLVERRFMSNAEMGKAFCFSLAFCSIIAVIIQILRRYG